MTTGSKSLKLLAGKVAGQPCGVYKMMLIDEEREEHVLAMVADDAFLSCPRVLVGTRAEKLSWYLSRLVYPRCGPVAGREPTNVRIFPKSLSDRKQHHLPFVAFVLL